jgi:DNA polymerase III delta subunit
MPGRLTPTAFRARIAAGTLEPLYLVTGDDDAEMTALASALSESIDADVRAFNVQRFFGSDSGTKLAMVCDAARTLPMLASRRVVVLHQAEQLLAGRRGRSADADADADSDAAKPTAQLALLRDYAASPAAHAVVAVIGAGLEKAFDALARQATVVVCELSSDVIRALEAEHGVRFDRQAAERLRQRAGADLARLRADAERAVLYAAGRSPITEEIVAEVMGRASAANNLWPEIASRRTAAALRELGLELGEGAAPVQMLGLLRSVAERTVAARDLPAAVDALMRTDLALKSSSGDPRVLLERLVVELCGMAREPG